MTHRDMTHSQLPTIQSSLLAAVPGVRHAFFTRQGGSRPASMTVSMSGAAARTSPPT
jgi:hypothetical protein